MGTAFALRPLFPGSGIYLKTTIYDFYESPTDGAAPESGLILDAHGNLFGTTFGGGTGCDFGNGCGTVFELTRLRRDTAKPFYIDSKTIRRTATTP